MTRNPYGNRFEHPESWKSQNTHQLELILSQTLILAQTRPRY